MNLLLLRFTIPKSKLYEFDLAVDRLVKWPVFKLHTTSDLSFETFQFIRNWKSTEDMQTDLSSTTFNNLIGVIKVLGQIEQSNIFTVNEQNEFSLEHY
jgi:hypothetical protein